MFSLLPPFAFLGLIGGWLAADIFRVGMSDSIRWLLLVFTPLVSGGLGRFLSPRLRSGPLTLSLSLVGAILAAGAINGVLIGFFAAAPMGAVVGLIAGLICAIPFVPALSAVAFVARRIGRARLGSIVDRADRRAVFCATLVVASLASVLTPTGALGPGRVNIFRPLAAVAFALILLAIDIGALVRACAALKQSIAVTLADTPLAPAPEKRARGATIVDFGLGDEEVEEVAHEGAVYREQKRTLRVFRGSAAQAQDALAWMIAADVTALVLVCLSLLRGVEHAFGELTIASLLGLAL